LIKTLQMAATKGHIGILKGILKSQPTELTQSELGCDSPLGLALVQNRTKAVKYLISQAKKYPVLLTLSQDDFQVFGSLIHHAVMQCNVQVVKMILHQDINIKNRKKETPLIVAVN
jgi:hypothetical protein